MYLIYIYIYTIINKFIPKCEINMTSINDLIFQIFYFELKNQDYVKYWIE